MVIFTVGRAKKIIAVMAGLAVIMVVILGIAGLAGIEYYRQVKADRSNAMQVTKTVTVEQVVPAASPDFFTEYRLERDKNRSERSDLLRESIKTASSEEARQHSQDAILKLMQEKQHEAEMENLIKARGFADALVFIRDNSVSVVVKTTSLSREEVIQVADIISRVSGVKAEDITISAKP